MRFSRVCLILLMMVDVKSFTMSNFVYRSISAPPGGPIEMDEQRYLLDAVYSTIFDYLT
jgi:hypothetical protein